MELPPPPPATSSTLLSLDAAAIKLENAPILSDVNITVSPPMRIAVIGNVGAGKSTLLKALSGQLPIASGTRTAMKWLQLLYWDASSREAFDPEEEEPLGFVRRLSAGALDENGALELLDTIGIDKFAARRPCGCLSSGERTRLAQCTMAVSPKHLFLLDEPCTFLGATAIESLGVTLSPENWPGGTLVYASNVALPCLQPTHTAIVLNGRVTIHERPPSEEDWDALKKAAVKAEAQAVEATEAMSANGGRKRPRREGDEAEEAVAVDAAAAAALDEEEEDDEGVTAMSQ